MSLKERTFASEKGAVFVQVGISIFVMMAFNVFVLDYGMMWVGRRQAQNAADAGALAGATARAFEDFDSTPSSSGLAAQSAQQVVATNLVWRESATPQVLFECPAGVVGDCVRVNVFRNGTNGSDPLPTLFGPIFGIANQGVQATATAMVTNGNTTTCLKPFAMPDEWQEYGTSRHWLPTDTFNQWSPSGTLETNPDSYTQPGPSTASSVNVSGHYGNLDRIQFDVDYPFSNPITPGFVLPLTLPGGRTYTQNMTSCSGQPISIGERLSIDMATVGASGTETALQAAYNLDAGADFNYGDNYVVDTCAPACASQSPRLFAIPLYDPSEFQLSRATGNWSACPGASPCIVIRNIVGFFIHRLSGPPYGRHGHFLKYPGMTSTTAPTHSPDASWLASMHLIR